MMQTSALGPGKILSNPAAVAATQQQHNSRQRSWGYSRMLVPSRSEHALLTTADTNLCFQRSMPISANPCQPSLRSGINGASTCRRSGIRCDPPLPLQSLLLEADARVCLCPTCTDAGVCNPNLSTSLREAFATLMLMSDDPFLSGLCPGECDITACVCGEVQR